MASPPETRAERLEAYRQSPSLTLHQGGPKPKPPPPSLYTTDAEIQAQFMGRGARKGMAAENAKQREEFEARDKTTSSSPFSVFFTSERQKQEKEKKILAIHEERARQAALPRVEDANGKFLLEEQAK